MGFAYYIILDNKEPEFDTLVGGWFIANDIHKLSSICRRHKIKLLEDFITMSPDDIYDMLGDDVDLPEEYREKWFTADEGISLVTTLINHIRENPKDVKNADGVLKDLTDFLNLFEKARGIGAKWHFNVDI
jgi:hypothetical protein